MRIALPFVAIIAVIAVLCAVSCGASSGPQRRRYGSTLISGLVIVLVGTVLLLDRMGILYARDVFRFWPVALIVIGLVGILHPDRPGKLVSSGVIGLAGVLLLLMELQVVHFTLAEIWPVFIIAAGLLMIWTALHPHPSWVQIGKTVGSASSSPHMNVTSIFSDGTWAVTAPDFQTGYIRAVFAGFKVDMTPAEIAGDRAYVNLDVVFSGGELRIPGNWNVLFEVQPVFGSCEDKTRRYQQPATVKTLVLRGKVVFGSIEVRN